MENKIYNNLTIDNLINTDWFDKFDKKQQKLIVEGLIANLDVSWYADTRFTAWQMEEIMDGLGSKLEPSYYADPKFNASQMEEIKKGL